MGRDVKCTQESQRWSAGREYHTQKRFKLVWEDRRESVSL